MRRFVRPGVLALMMLGLMTRTAAPQSALKADDALIDVLVFGTHMKINLDSYAGDLRSELEAALARARAYTSPRKPRGSSGLDQMVHEAWVGYERKLVAFADDADARALAGTYVDRLRPCYEWEGFHDCPEAEAQFAEQYLADHPASPFREYLPLLAAHRWLCTAEAYDFEKRPNDAARAGRAYDYALSTARQSSSALIRTAAAALQIRGRCFPGR